jgi:cytochrome c oxidase cbb3-type subunit III
MTQRPSVTSLVCARTVYAAIVLAGAAGLSGCEREQRRFQQPPPASAASQSIQLSELQAGPSTPRPPSPDPYKENAYGVNEGKRLFSWYNCEGCHAKGGGGIGPPLMDANWIYGAEPANIFATIVQGRPNGMPSFRGRIPENQVWQLVAYVRSMSALVRRDAIAGRDDGIQKGKPEQRRSRAEPQNSSEASPK